MVKVKSAIILTICLFLCSCVYSHYTGRYWIGKSSPSFISKSASEEDNNKIIHVVRDVAKEFGFIEHEKPEGESKDFITFGKGSETKGKHEELKGAEGPLSIIVEIGPYPAVGIKDWERNYETDFLKALKSELGKRLAEVIDMEGVTFRRSGHITE